MSCLESATNWRTKWKSKSAERENRPKIKAVSCSTNLKRAVDTEKSWETLRRENCCYCKSWVKPNRVRDITLRYRTRTAIWYRKSISLKWWWENLRRDWMRQNEARIREANTQCLSRIWELRRQVGKASTALFSQPTSSFMATTTSPVQSTNSPSPILEHIRTSKHHLMQNLPIRARLQRAVWSSQSSQKRRRAVEEVALWTSSQRAGRWRSLPKSSRWFTQNLVLSKEIDRLTALSTAQFSELSELRLRITDETSLQKRIE